MDILKLSKIIENCIDKHKQLDHLGSGMWIDKVPERDIEVHYKKKDYLITIKEVKE